MGTTREDYAYLAGLIDGEGCIYGHIQKKDKKHRNKTTNVNLKIRMLEKEIIDWIYVTFGGNMSEIKRPIGQNNRWEWRIAKAEDFIPLLEKVIPFLKLKKHRAEIALTLKRMILEVKKKFVTESNKKDRLKREYIVSEIKRENQRIKIPLRGAI